MYVCDREEDLVKSHLMSQSVDKLCICNCWDVKTLRFNPASTEKGKADDLSATFGYLVQILNWRQTLD